MLSSKGDPKDQAEDLFGEFEEGENIDKSSNLNDAAISRIDKALGELDDGFGDFQETENDQEDGMDSKPSKQILRPAQARNYDVFEELVQPNPQQAHGQILSDSILENPPQNQKLVTDEPSDLFEASELAPTNRQNLLQAPTINVATEDSITGVSMMKDIKQLDDLLGVEFSKPEDLQNILQQTSASGLMLDAKSLASPNKAVESHTLIDLLGEPAGSTQHAQVDDPDEFGEEIEVADPPATQKEFLGLNTEFTGSPELLVSSPLMGPTTNPSQNDTLNLTAPFPKPMKLQPQGIPEEVDEEFGEELEAGRIEDSSQHMHGASGIEQDPMLADLQESRHLGISIIKSHQKQDLLGDTSQNEPFDLKGLEDKSSPVKDQKSSHPAVADYDDLLGGNIPPTTQGNDDLQQSVEHQRDQLISLLNTQHSVPNLQNRDENQSMDLGDPFGSFLGASVAPDGPPLNTDILSQLNGAEARNERFLEEIREEPSLRSDADNTRNDRLNQALGMDEAEFGEEIEEQTIDLGNPVLNNLSQIRRDDPVEGEEPSANFDELSPSVVSSKKKRKPQDPKLTSESENNLNIRLDPGMIEIAESENETEYDHGNILGQEMRIEMPRESAASQPNLHVMEHVQQGTPPIQRHADNSDDEDLFDDFQEEEAHSPVAEHENGEQNAKSEGNEYESTQRMTGFPKSQDLESQVDAQSKDIDFVEVQPNIGEMVELTAEGSDRLGTGRSDSSPTDNFENQNFEVSPRPKSTTSPRTNESDEIEVKEQRIVMLTEGGQEFESPRESIDDQLPTYRSAQPNRAVITVQPSMEDPEDDLFAEEVQVEVDHSGSAHVSPDAADEKPELPEQDEESLPHTKLPASHQLLRPHHTRSPQDGGPTSHQDTPIKTSDLETVDGLRPTGEAGQSHKQITGDEEDLFSEDGFQEAPVSVDIDTQEIESNLRLPTSSAKKSVKDDEEEDLFGDEVEEPETVTNKPQEETTKAKEHPNQANASSVAQVAQAKQALNFDANQVDTITELCELFQKSLHKVGTSSSTKRTRRPQTKPSRAAINPDTNSHSRIFSGKAEPCADHFEWLGRMTSTLSTTRGPLSPEDRFNYHLHRKIILGYFQESVFNNAKPDPSAAAVPIIKGFVGADVSAANIRIREDKDRLLSERFVKSLEDYTHIFAEKD